MPSFQRQDSVTLIVWQSLEFMAINQTFQVQSLRVQSQTLLDSYTLFMLFIKHSLAIKFLNFTTDSSFSNIPHIKQQAAFYANRNLFLTSNMLIRNNLLLMEMWITGGPAIATSGVWSCLIECFLTLQLYLISILADQSWPCFLN